MLISVGSKNPAKIAAVENVFKEYSCEVVSVDVPSGVRPQPFSDDETIKGAANRAVLAAKEAGVDIGIGLEGGVQQTDYGLFLCNWGVLKANDMAPIIAGGARISLPQVIAEQLLAGEELGPVMDEYAKRQNVRKNEGAIGVFTNGSVNRVEMFSHIMQLLLGQYEFKINIKNDSFLKSK